MLFDKLCGIVERPEDLHGPTRGEGLPAALVRQLLALRQVVDAAQVFEFPVLPHESEFRQEVIRENRELLGERFCLPFRTVAVEDKASCIILTDLEPDGRGLASERGFVEIFPLHVDSRNFGDRESPVDPAVLATLNVPADAMAICWGNVFNVQYLDLTEPRTHFNYRCGGAIWANKKGVYFHSIGEDAKDHVSNTLQNVRVAIEEIAYANMPSQWVVEILTAQSNETAGVGRLRRAHQRPRFTTLTPGELRKIFGRETEGDRQSPVAHRRRGHWRLLQSDRFAKSGLKGQHRWIEATWVGETEAVVGNKKYIVRTDL